MGIGANVRKFRTRLGIDQKTLASRLGVTTGAVSNYENDVSSPREEVLYKMFEVFGVTPNELFEGCYLENEKSPEPEGAEDEVSVDEMREVLVALGYIRPDRELSESDVDFILGIGKLLNTWFCR